MVKVQVDSGVDAAAEEAVVVQLEAALDSSVQMEVHAPLGPVNVYAQSATARERREVRAMTVFILIEG